MVLLVSRIKPTGEVHRLWRNYWERGRPGWLRCGEQRLLSPPHRPTPAPLAESCSPPAAHSGQTASPLLRMAAGTVFHMVHDLFLIEARSWAEADGYFLPEPSTQERRAPAASWAPLPIRSYLCRRGLTGGERRGQVLWVTPEKEGIHQESSANTKLN